MRDVHVLIAFSCGTFGQSGLLIITIKKKLSNNISKRFYIRKHAHQNQGMFPSKLMYLFVFQTLTGKEVIFRSGASNMCEDGVGY